MEFELREIGLTTPVMTVLTQVRVDPDDPAFKKPSKPIGPFYSRADADDKSQRFGWTMVEDAARGYRRVVPSPVPVEVFERHIIRNILELGMIVIAVGGGGIPVIEHGYKVTGAEAVIDKDRASSLLAVDLKADLFVISTDADAVYVDYKKPAQRKIEKTTVGELEKWSDEGQFPLGSMGPKIEAAVHYLRNGGKEVIITSYECLMEALEGRAGTHIVP
jgi:carbamate kinase